MILQVRLEVILHHLLRQSLAVTLSDSLSLYSLSSQAEPNRERAPRASGGRTAAPRGTAACLIRTG